MIRLRSVSFAYREGELVLDATDLELPAGLTLLLGPNGCGKTTVMKLAAGVERPDRGTAEILGRDLWRDEIAARRPLAYVSEQPEMTPFATIQDVIDLVCRLRLQPLEHGRAALERAGLSGLRRRSIRELSMGQRRRAVLAAAWVGDPRVVLLDEPLEAMDRRIREEIVTWVDLLLRREAAVVVSTHQLEPFIGMAVRAVSVIAGKCRVWEPLPEPEAERAALVERISRGQV